MILPLIATLLLSPQAAPIDVGRDSTKSFAWDWDGTHSDGTPGAEVTRVTFEFSQATVGVQPIVVVVPHLGVTGENRVLVKDTLAGVPAGVYDLTVRLVDPGGQTSDPSPVLSIRVRVKNPSAPKNVRVVLLYSGDSLHGWGKMLSSVS